MANGKKRKSDNKEKSEINSPKVSKRSVRPRSASNESKQTKKQEKKVVETEKVQLKINVDQVKSTNNKKRKQNPERTVVQVLEDDELVTMDVQGIDTEYGSEDNGEESLRSDSDEESSNEDVEGNERTESINNNATALDGRRGNRIVSEDEESICDSQADTIKEGDQLLELGMSDEEDGALKDEEFAMFEKWEKYLEMKKKKELKKKTDEKGETSRAKAKPADKKIKKKKTAEPKKGTLMSITSPSETTIYKTAVRKSGEVMRQSSSSEEDIDTSEDNLDDLINQFTGSQRIEEDDQRKNEEFEEESMEPRENLERKFIEQEEEHDRRRPEVSRPVEDPIRIVERRAEQRIRDAEKGKARIYEVSGKDLFNSAALIDEDFELIESQVSEKMIEKIVNNEYVNFAKLLPKDKLVIEEEDRYQMFCNKKGETFWAPPEKSSGSINSIEKWDEAFRVFSKIYSKFKPERACELVEYSQLIHTAASTFVWANVYNYDRHFRLFLSKHSERKWGIILQQAWMIYLCEKIPHSNQNPTNRPSSSDGSRRTGKICYKFNKGRCNFGYNCKFDHRCGICMRFGHGATTCRKITNPNDSDRESFGKGKYFDKDKDQQSYKQRK